MKLPYVAYDRRQVLHHRLYYLQLCLGWYPSPRARKFEFTYCTQKDKLYTIFWRPVDALMSVISNKIKKDIEKEIEQALGVNGKFNILPLDLDHLDG